MASIGNKYGVDISQKKMDDYNEELIGNCFKLLGIYEGRDPRTKEIIYPTEIAYEHYSKYLENLCIELWGAYLIFHESEHFLKLANTLEGMQKIKIDEHAKLKSLVFNCISLCKKLKGVV